ncbi:HAMP domain-containing histidine kinase [Alteromonadaceae bacterium M269]|nr:HAMP domain-containing histidine kinase [Alteromonadaceae bacterium M269]
MKISTKLLVIVILTLAEISLTLWSVFEISKGAKFHQLNSLHLKYSAVFSEQVDKLNSGYQIDTDMLRHTIEQIRQQPTECLAQVNILNEIIMKQIGTYHALGICEQDIIESNNALAILDKFDNKEIDEESAIVELKNYVLIFNENSSLFEKPIADTVSFVMRTMIPMVIFISLFNIIFIGYMSRSISGSIRGLISLMSSEGNNDELERKIDQNVSGELKELLDVTKERLTNEIMMNEVNEKLEAVVTARTRSLEKANSELEQFAYRTSHDLKAPLTSTKGLARFIIQDIEGGQLENAKDDASKIVEQMGKLESLVEGILSLSAANSDVENIKALDIRKLIDESKEPYSGDLESMNFKVVESIQLESPMISEEVRVKQIIDNLVSNAIKYADKAKEQPCVNISVYDDLDNYYLDVEDNGLGIPEHRQNEVFQMFKRFHPTVNKGSGLGMSIIKKHVDSLNGSIEMKSSEKGTKFSVVIPREITE